MIFSGHLDIDIVDTAIESSRYSDLEDLSMDQLENLLNDVLTHQYPSLDGEAFDVNILFFSHFKYIILEIFSRKVLLAVIQETFSLRVV